MSEKMTYETPVRENLVRKHAKNISELKQKLADATTAHAAGWKAAQKDGINNESLKHVLKLGKQDEVKSQEFVRHSRYYAQVLGYENQLNLFEDAETSQPDQEQEQPAEDKVEASVGKQKEMAVAE